MATQNKKSDKGYRSLKEFKMEFLPKYFEKEIKKSIISNPRNFSNYLAGVFIKRAKKEVNDKVRRIN